MTDKTSAVDNETQQAAAEQIASENAVIAAIVGEIADERLAQLARWGQQDHPSSYGESDRRQAERTADYWKQINDVRVQFDVLSWDGILLEEVYEALGEADPLLRREELIQVAAVAAAEIEAIDRLLASEDSPYETFDAVEDDETEEDHG